MDLILRVSGSGVPETPVMVTIDGEASGAALTAALADHLGVRSTSAVWWWERTGVALGDVGDLTALEPRDGDRILIADRSAAPLAGAPLGAPARVEVVVGPDRGRGVDLVVGATTVGRAKDAGLRLADDATSRQHCRFTFDGAVVTVEDLGSTNGTKVGGVRITSPTPVPDGSEVRLGESVLRITVPEVVVAPPSADVRWADGVITVNRPPRVVRPSPATKIEIPAAPEVAQVRRIPVIAMIAPLVFAGVMWVAMTLAEQDFAPTMLLFGLMSPVMLAANYFSDRKAGAGDAAKRRAEYDRAFGAAQGRLRETATASRAHRIDACPAPDALAGWASTTAARLWERRPRDADFLALRIGLADRPSLVEVVVPDPPRNADEDAVESNRSLATEHAIDRGVPVSVHLDESGVVGFHGPFDLTAAVLRSSLLQIAALHSPSEVAIVAIVPDASASDWSWMAWLPHTAMLSASGFRSIVPVAQAATIFDALEAIISAREAALEQRAALAVRTPRVVLVLPESDLLPAARLGRLLERGPNVGVLALAAAGSTAALPGECQAVVELGGQDASVTWTRVGVTVAGVTPDRCGVEMLESAAIALAPLRDPSGSGSAGVPTSVTCGEMAAFDMTDAKAIRRRWEMPDTTLTAPIGIGGSGTVSISLRKDGPHGVVAGTTGAGKSEFLQTLIASLAAHHSPERLALVLVDLKGGAAFQDLAQLPHTVGFFTDLDEHLAGRALISLNAELRRREEILRDAGVKDLIDLEASGRRNVPPSLLIVFDEFAVIKTEMPDFIEGIVDIARRGRSLGVHMILATQSPTGVVDHHIRANTNLRVALRTANAQESQEIIERRDAADIPREVTGRAWIRIGQDEPTLVQTAYSGRRADPGVRAASVTVRPFGLSGAPPAQKPDDTSDRGPSDAQRTIAAAVEAARLAGIERGAAPWLPPLTEVVRLADLDATPTVSRASLAVPLGLQDDPARQAQDAYVVDLANDGNLAVYGTSGSGKTSTLRTLLAGIGANRAPGDCRFVILDFASRGLRSLMDLPHTVAYATADDGEVLERVLARLDAEIATRRDLVAAMGAASLAEARSMDPSLDVPFIVLVVDGISGFLSQYQDVDLGAVVDEFTRIVVEGRSAGVFTAVTADRRAAIPMTLASALSERVILRMTEEDDYLWLGVPEARDVVFVEGRGVLPGGRELQVAVAGAEPTAAAQQAHIAAIGEHWGDIEIDRIGPIAERVSVPDSGDGPIPVGLDGLLDRPVGVDLDDLGAFLVVGTDRAGRSTALRTLTDGWRRRHPDGETYLIAPRRSPLTDDDWTDRCVHADEAEDFAARVAERVQADAVPALLVIDDGDQLPENAYGSNIDALLRRARDARFVMLGAMQSRPAARAFSGWVRDLRDAKRGLILMPDADRDADIFGGRMPRRAGRSFPAGRGYLVEGDQYTYVQVAADVDAI